MNIRAGGRRWWRCKSTVRIGSIIVFDIITDDVTPLVIIRLLGGQLRLARVERRAARIFEMVSARRSLGSLSIVIQASVFRRHDTFDAAWEIDGVEYRSI